MGTRDDRRCTVSKDEKSIFQSDLLYRYKTPEGFRLVGEEWKRKAAEQKCRQDLQDKFYRAFVQHFAASAEQKCRQDLQDEFYRAFIQHFAASGKKATALSPVLRNAAIRSLEGTKRLLDYLNQNDIPVKDWYDHFRLSIPTVRKALHGGGLTSSSWAMISEKIGVPLETLLPSK